MMMEWNQEKIIEMVMIIVRTRNDLIGYTGNVGDTLIAGSDIIEMFERRNPFYINRAYVMNNEYGTLNGCIKVYKDVIGKIAPNEVSIYNSKSKVAINVVFGDEIHTQFNPDRFKYTEFCTEFSK